MCPHVNEWPVWIELRVQGALLRPGHCDFGDVKKPYKNPNPGELPPEMPFSVPHVSQRVLLTPGQFPFLRQVLKSSRGRNLIAVGRRRKNPEKKTRGPSASWPLAVA